MHKHNNRSQIDDMKKTALTFAVYLTITATVVTGCVSVHKVSIKDAPRKNVRFESAEAMQTFYDTLLAKHFPKDGKPSRVRVRVGETLYTSETRPSSDVAFNDGITVADTDGDGVVSEREARTYASTTSK